MSEEKKVTEMPTEVPAMETTRRELSDEAKSFINDATVAIIKDVLRPEDYNTSLCSSGVNINSDTKEFDSAMINLFNIPQSTTSFVPVLQIIIDLAGRKVIGQNNFVAPVVFRKDQNGVEREAVLLGRNGDIAIATASIVAEIMANAPAEEEPAEAASTAEAEHVEGDVVE